MPSHVVASKFQTLRSWDGEQSRAFEELSYQLLKDHAPTGTRPIRTGNPDGGVEWYATLPDNSEWGWQAKYIFDFDGLLSAMTESVERVAKERLNLVKLIFIIPKNLTTGTAGGQRKSQRKRYADKILTWQATIPRADNIEFDLIQESDLLYELAKPIHRGRAWFWWDDIVLGEAWLRHKLAVQEIAAGDKYHPDLQVDIPIQSDLLALGFDQSMLASFNRFRRAILAEGLDLKVHLPGGSLASALYEAVQVAARELGSIASTLDLQAGDPIATLTPLTDAAASCMRSIAAVRNHEIQLREAWNQLPKDSADKERQPPDRFSSRRTDLERAIDDLAEWLESSIGRAFQHRAYFLTGEAGSGKTHLLLDATSRALDEHRPAVFLAGGQLGQSDLWASITDQLGLATVGSDQLLQAMDSAGEAAFMSGSRFVICVDALNETTPIEFWLTRLNAFRAAIAAYPHLALVISCRDTYRDVVLQESEAKHYIERRHPGFAGREVEATHKYFAHYGLEAPKIPLLTPEFTLPLFLRLYCEGYQGASAQSIPAGHQGRVSIFERYVDRKIETVARSLSSAALSSFEIQSKKMQVSAVVDALLDAMSNSGHEALATTEAETLTTSLLDGDRNEAVKMLGRLQAEGVLTRERIYLPHTGYGEGVRIVFQAFGDYLLLRRRVARSTDPLPDDELRQWLSACSWGVIETATIYFPEIHGIELPDLLGLRPLPKRITGDGTDPVIQRRYQGRRRLLGSLVHMLPYRDSKAVTERTLELLNEAQQYLTRAELFVTLFMLAPQPDNMLNGERLHSHLSQFRMPQRDQDFGFTMYRGLSDGFGAVARLARWAASGPYPEYDTRVLELACIPLCWLLSSPNRYMRDWITKALVELLQGHLDVMQSLVERFWTVNDPYIVQRVVAIAYGSLLRSQTSQTDSAKNLVQSVLDRVFRRPIRADELLLDAGRGIARWALEQRLIDQAKFAASLRPYGLKPPGSAPTEATLEARYGRSYELPNDESYSSIYFSLTDLGDFGHYVIQSVLHHFSRYRFDQAYPKQDRRPRLMKGALSRFVESLTAEQKQMYKDWIANPNPQYDSFSKLHMFRGKDSLTSIQRELYESVWAYPKYVDERYPSGRASRWVFQRTISLGWSPQMFGEADRTLGHGSGRESHKAERWGKKYQWMAYHELLARIADNYQPPRTLWGDEPYEGLHQIIGEREIDPSLPPVDFRDFIESREATAWRSSPLSLREWPPGKLDFPPYQRDIHRFLHDTSTEPTLRGSLIVLDNMDTEWVVLESSTRQVDSIAVGGWIGPQQQAIINTLLIPANRSKRFLEDLPVLNERVDPVSDLIDSHGHVDCCYVGEVGRAAPLCPHRQDHLRAYQVGDKSYDLVATVESYGWEGGILDCSIEQTARTVLPSAFLQSSVGLAFDIRGPSWLDDSGRPIFVFYEEPDERGHALLVRSTFLMDFLTERGLELLVFHWFERMELHGGSIHDGPFPYIESNQRGRLTSKLRLEVCKPQRVVRDLPE